MTRILVVEDDPDIAALVRRYLEKAGFSVDTLASGREALTAIAAKPPDLLVLDLMLPHVDGLEICRNVRGNPATAAIPVIMLTARAEESERIVGLELGADDYVAKPFSPNELVARVRALLRRAQREPAPSAAASAAITYGPIILDPERHTVSLDGEPATLTAKEFLLLSYLLFRQGLLPPHIAAECLLGLIATRNVLDLIAFGFEVVAEQHGQRLLVFNDQDARAHRVIRLYLSPAARSAAKLVVSPFGRWSVTGLPSIM